MIGHTTRRCLQAVAIGLLPVVVAIALSKLLFDASLEHAIPYINDEVAYWNQIATFQAAGFNGGYITVDERPSASTWSHFGPHGPAFAIVYGLPARAVGWSYTSGPVFGAIAFFIATAAWAFLARPSPWVAAALVASYWPIALALPSTMQEPLHFAFAAVLAALLGSLFKGAEHSIGAVLATIAMLGVAGVVRPVWTLTAIPLGWHLFRGRGSLQQLVGLAGGVIFVGVVFVAFSRIASPFPSVTFSLVSDLAVDWRDTGYRLLRRATIASPRDWVSSDSRPFELFFRAELIGITILTFAVCFWRSADVAARRVAGFATAMLLLLVAAVFATDNIGSWQDYRATTPVLFMLLLMAATVRLPLLWTVIAVNIAAAPLAVGAFKELHDGRFEKTRIEDIAEFEKAARPFIEYDPALPPWGNTVLVHADRYQAPLLGLPRGIAASAVVYWNRVTMPMKSHYVLLAPDEFDTIRHQVRLRELTDTSLGRLYENLDWRR